ncbi:helix-turn-helix domain-containing protein [Pedobacter sp. B4-66]|uniref:GlxA family transcriptional regulator n=1 Tax=Pedobacter sp. B4-66 TaxID=2817280 RepID=UPI001BD9AFAB|nr:helix-turn-helix domain-containing protein [Pedobacter sp. B4-66]
MKHISVLVPIGVHIGIVDGTCDLFTEANDFLVSLGRQPYFHLNFVGISREITSKGGLFSVKPNDHIDAVKKTDLIIIPPCFQTDLQTTIDKNKEFLKWIQGQHNHHGSEIASLCIGAFLLASTGLLDQRKCATNWMVAEDFKKMFPKVMIETDKVIVDERGLYSSGGGYSYMNLILYLIEKYTGREVAVHCSKVFQIDISYKSQSAFIIFSGQKQHSDEKVKSVQKYIEEHFQEKITVDELAQLYCIGRRSLELRFKKATSNTIVEYLQRVKIEAAKRNFELSKKSVNEVMFETGYTDSKAFRSLFKRITGVSPIEYSNKYSTLKH